MGGDSWTSGSAARDLVYIFGIAFLLAGAFLCAFVACATSDWSPFPAVAISSTIVAMIITPLFCHDQQDSIGGDVGWFFTGAFVTAPVGITAMLWRTDNISNTGALLTLTSFVLTVVCMLLFIFVICGGNCCSSGGGNSYDF